MESKPEKGHGKTGESAKKKHINDTGLQGFELRGKVEKVWTNNTIEKEEQRRLNRNLEDYYTGEDSIEWEREPFELVLKR